MAGMSSAWHPADAPSLCAVAAWPDVADVVNGSHDLCDGVVWSLLWNQPLQELMPFFGIGVIIWNFMTQVLTECTSIFVTHGSFYRNQKMIFSVSVYSVIYNNTMMLAYNLIVVVVLIIAFGVPSTGICCSSCRHWC
jgi:ABC-type polysaccharide/polyol phosphate export permease